MRDYAITASKYSVVPGDSKYEIETQRWIWASFLLCALETGWLGLGAVSCECKETGFNTQKNPFWTADILFASSNLFLPYLRTTESTPFRQPTVSATTANLAEVRLDPRHQCLPEIEMG